VAADRLLHVVNGDSVATTLRATSLVGTVVSWRDVLHEGPVPALPRGELLRRRAAFLAECGWGSEVEIRSSLERRDRMLTEALAEETVVVAWFEHDLYDQLQLLDVLSLAHDVGRPPELIVVGSFPGRPRFRGLGELTAAELETLWDERRLAPARAVADAVAAWDAFREPDPEALARVAATPSAALPFLAPALRRLLEELPAPGDGLGGTERRALRAVAEGAQTPVEAFLRAQELEDAPFLGDTWFFRSLAELGRGESRLVGTSDGGELPAPPPLGDTGTFSALSLRLTELGERVLAGEADRVALLGLDRWIGGTHVTAARAWRWDARRGVLVAP
jgi:hypothetical protein